MNSISSTNVGTGYELDAIAAVIIGETQMTGGNGTIFGTVLGAIILGLINNMLNMLGVSPYGIIFDSVIDCFSWNYKRQDKGRSFYSIF